MYFCEICNDELHPLSEPGIVYAVELELIESPAGAGYVEGRGVFFHATCFPEESGRWRQKAMPVWDRRPRELVVRRTSARHTLQSRSTPAGSAAFPEPATDRT